MNRGEFYQNSVDATDAGVNIGQLHVPYKHDLPPAVEDLPFCLESIPSRRYPEEKRSMISASGGGVFLPSPLIPTERPDLGFLNRHVSIDGFPCDLHRVWSVL